jgi:hypothetical protein
MDDESGEELGVIDRQIPSLATEFTHQLLLQASKQ